MSSRLLLNNTFSQVFLFLILSERPTPFCGRHQHDTWKKRDCFRDVVTRRNL